jgi:3-phenylpropionate/trans-cinnamate dioxygenase ferredoxin reductase subunit
VASLEPSTHALMIKDGGTLRYDRLLIATGATPRRLPAARGSNVFYLRSIDESAAIGARLRGDSRVVIVGGGWIGLEVAAAARKRGAGVTVVEALSRLCSRAAPQDVSDELLSLHRARGVDVRLATVVTQFEGEDDVRRVVLSSGAIIDVSLVVIGIGIVPATGLAANAGLEIDNGIAIDSRMCTSAPDVFAAGDVASYVGVGGKRTRLESWDNAQKQGIAAGKAMLGIETPLDAFPWFWSDQFDWNVQLVGDFGEYDERLQLVSQTPGGRLTVYRRHGATVGAVGVNAARDVRLIKRSLENRQPLPQSMMGPSGTVATGI